MKSPRIWCVVLASVTLPLGCSRDQPAAPPRLHSITGHVRLTGFLVDNVSHFAGTRVVGDADNVQVELLFGNQVIARTTTVDGVYRFSGLGPGGYVARSRVIRDIGDETEPLTLADFDLAVADTLRLVSRGDLLPTPNPIGQGTDIYFDLPALVHVDMKIIGMAGDTVRTLVNGDLAPGLNRIRWDGVNQMGQPTTAPIHWVTLAPAGYEVRAHLLFR